MNQVRASWSRGSPAVLGWLQIPAALSAEALAGCGYHALVVDLQHSPTDFVAAVEMFTAIECGGAEPFVRVRANDASGIMKLLDCGARGVIVPMIETAEQARAFASALHYPPRGTRSFGPRRPLLRYGPGYPEFASETIVGLAMIETALGLKNLDEILATPGIDGIFIGPADLALALGAPPEADSQDPRVVAAIRAILARAREHNKRAGIFCGSAAFARRRLAEGFDLVSLTPDLSMLLSAARSVLDAIQPLQLQSPPDPASPERDSTR
jgi:4-hydroxy-2-oxoheptanedioate aldolase